MDNDTFVGISPEQFVKWMAERDRALELLSFYADPYSHPDTGYGQGVPVYYGEMDFGGKAREFLMEIER